MTCHPTLLYSSTLGEVYCLKQSGSERRVLRHTKAITSPPVCCFFNKLDKLGIIVYAIESGIMHCSIILYLLIVCLALQLTTCSIVQYDYNNFPSNVVALHMPCQESNMFATKCMCHIKCIDNTCSNAKSICTKYESRYSSVLLSID